MLLLLERITQNRINMETMTVKEFKNHFSEALKRVMLGEEIGIWHKNGKEILAFLVPKN